MILNELLRGILNVIGVFDIDVDLEGNRGI